MRACVISWPGLSQTPASVPNLHRLPSPTPPSDGLSLHAKHFPHARHVAPPALFQQDPWRLSTVLLSNILPTLNTLLPSSVIPSLVATAQPHSRDRPLGTSGTQHRNQENVYPLLPTPSSCPAKPDHQRSSRRRGAFQDRSVRHPVAGACIVATRPDPSARRH